MSKRTTGSVHVTLLQWDLVCDDAWLVSMVSTIYMAGRLVGALTCGFVSDGYA